MCASRPVGGGTVALDCMGQTGAAKVKCVAPTFSSSVRVRTDTRASYASPRAMIPPARSKRHFSFAATTRVCSGGDTCQDSQVLPMGFKYCGD